MIKVLVSGAYGKMGAETVKAVEAASDMDVVSEVGSDDDLKDAIFMTKPDVVIDFTHPGVVYDNVTTILEAGCHAVVGTTGLSDEQLATLDALAKRKERAFLLCPNFAIGAILMMKFAAEAAKYMPSVEIVELHHDKKADAPSGTAIKTAEMIADTDAVINSGLDELSKTESVPGARGGVVRNIPIHSLRLPGLVAHQEVVFGGLGQTLTIRHDTINRESFMPGVVLAVRKAKDYTGLVYGLDQIL